MPVNQRRLAQIMLEQCAQIDERVPGYRGALIDHLIQILDFENAHRRGGGMPIKQQITAQCEALGAFLAQKRKQIEGAN